MPNTPGDARTSPFGDGKGDIGMATGSGNDFVTNPKGTGIGSSKGGGQPPSYGVSRPQQYGAAPTNPQDAPAGGRTAAEVTGGGTPAQDAGNPIGTVVGNAAHKPFKLGA
jgi:hypothetical protein